MELWLPKVLAPTTKDGKRKLERVHRVSGPTRRWANSCRPYPQRFHHYSDRVRVLEAARHAKDVHFEDSRIFLLQDFSSGTQRKRHAFDEEARRTYGIYKHTGWWYFTGRTSVSNGNGTAFDWQALTSVSLLLSPQRGSTDFFLSFFFSVTLYHLPFDGMDTNYSLSDWDITDHCV